MLTASLFLLIACSNEEPPMNIDEKQVTESNVSDIPSTEHILPKLDLLVNEQKIRTSFGIYSWSYTDPKTGENNGVEASALAPFEIVNLENAIAVNVDKMIQLNFEQNPNNYQIKLWNEKEVVSTYTSFADVKEKGKYAVEIVAHFDEGTVTYVCALQFL